MGAVAAAAAACAGEDLIRFLPLIAIVFLACWILLIIFYGGCRPFCRQLAEELRELLHLRPATTPGSHGYIGRYGDTVFTPSHFAPPIQQTLVGALNAQLMQPGGMVPSEYVCPITQEVMQDPVMAADGHTYEYEAIQRHIASGTRTATNVSPMTGDRLSHAQLVQNHSLRALIVQAGERALREQPAQRAR